MYYLTTSLNNINLVSMYYLTALLLTNIPIVNRLPKYFSKHYKPLLNVLPNYFS